MPYHSQSGVGGEDWLRDLVSGQALDDRGIVNAASIAASDPRG